jgi:hypothetical protein
VLSQDLASPGNTMKARMLTGPSGPGQEDWMTFNVKLERADGTPAEPPTIKSTVTNWRVGTRSRSAAIGRFASSASSSRMTTSRFVEDVA